MIQTKPFKAAMTKPSRAGRRKARTYDPQRAKDDILRVATKEFAARGLSGARVDAIAERMRTSKRMIYYYFGSKEGLYLAVLEKAYAGIRSIETGLRLEGLPPMEALRHLVEATFDYDDAHPEFIRLVSIENIHYARHLAAAAPIKKLNASIIGAIETILKRGREQGSFKNGIQALDLHFVISALCFFRVSNQQTFNSIFNCNLSDPQIRERHRRMIVEAVIGLVSRA